MNRKLIHSDDITDTYETNLGIITVWKKDGKNQDGVNGKEGASKMIYSDPPPVKMRLKKKYKKA